MCSCISRLSHAHTHNYIHTPSSTTATLCQGKGQGDSLKRGQFHSRRLEAVSSVLKAVLAATQPDCITKWYCREKKNIGDRTATLSSRDCHDKNKTSDALLIHVSWMQTLLLQDPHPHCNKLHSTAMWASAPRQETSAACFQFRWWPPNSSLQLARVFCPSRATQHFPQSLLPHTHLNGPPLFYTSAFNNWKQVDREVKSQFLSAHFQLRLGSAFAKPWDSLSHCLS